MHRAPWSIARAARSLRPSAPRSGRPWYVVRLLPRLIADVAHGAELLNVVVIRSKAGRLVDDSAAPSCYSGSGFGGRGAAGSARLGLAGLGQRSLARHLVPGIAADTAAPIRGDRVAWAFLTLVYHSATCGGRLGENFGDLGGRTAWAGRRIVEFFWDAPTGLDFHR